MCGPAAHWSHCASFPTRGPQHLAAGRLGAWTMWVRSPVCGHFPVVHADWSRPFNVPRATRCSTPCLSPVGHLGLRLGRGCFWSPITVFPSPGIPEGVPHPGPTSPTGTHTPGTFGACAALGGSSSWRPRLLMRGLEMPRRIGLLHKWTVDGGKHNYPLASLEGVRAK